RGAASGAFVFDERASDMSHGFLRRGFQDSLSAGFQHPAQRRFAGFVFFSTIRAFSLSRSRGTFD
ncbi:MULTISPECIES: hypothetical protein, partial [unclassified Sulfitobacter]|uniref:hypothetical protein n=1 Tax=unclassified Sulfitobacter TaxID=196795 RepID=UPI00374709E7